MAKKRTVEILLRIARLRLERLEIGRRGGSPPDDVCLLGIEYQQALLDLAREGYDGPIEEPSTGEMP